MKLGDKVVCIDASPCKKCGDDLGLIFNQVYVVSELILLRSGRYYINLIGFVSKCKKNHKGKFTGAGAWRFRLLDEIKQENQTKLCQSKSQAVSGVMTKGRK